WRLSFGRSGLIPYPFFSEMAEWGLASRHNKVADAQSPRAAVSLMMKLPNSRARFLLKLKMSGAGFSNLGVRLTHRLQWCFFLTRLVPLVGLHLPRLDHFIVRVTAKSIST